MHASRSHWNRTLDLRPSEEPSLQFLKPIEQSLSMEHGSASNYGQETNMLRGDEFEFIGVRRRGEE